MLTFFSLVSVSLTRAFLSAGRKSQKRSGAKSHQRMGTTSHTSVAAAIVCARGGGVCTLALLQIAVPS
jgi:hypothetical protein